MSTDHVMSAPTAHLSVYEPEKKNCHNIRPFRGNDLKPIFIFVFFLFFSPVFTPERDTKPYPITKKKALIKGYHITYQNPKKNRKNCEFVVVTHSITKTPKKEKKRS